MRRRVKVRLVALFAAVAAAIPLTVVGLTASSAATPAPIRASFYYPWFPETEQWQTQYHPTLGQYDSSNRTVLAAHVASAKYAGLDAFISSWWGVGSKTDERLPLVLDAAAAQGLAVTAYYEPAGKTTQPTDTQLQADLDRLLALSASPAWLRVDGKPVLFVYNAATSVASCDGAARYVNAVAGRFYLNLKVFSGYKTCPVQPDSWHQYGPSTAYHSHLPYATNVSPGFWKFNEASPRLARDLARFKTDLGRQVASGSQWQLTTSFNEWGEGSSVEPATEWQSPSGWGDYLDAMRDVYVNGATASPSPSPSNSPSPSVTPSSSVSPSSTPSPSLSESPTPSPTGTPAADVKVAAAGDIACDPSSGYFNGGNGDSWRCAQKRVSDLIVGQGYSGFLPLGDTQYETGAASAYPLSYGPSFGRVKDITRPAVGNHEYGTSGAPGYFGYFGAAAGDPAKGYYSYDVGAWHMVALNSERDTGSTGAQVTWLKADLAAHPNKCTLAYWHKPRWSSGEHGSQTVVSALWNAAAAGGVDLVLAGHDHDYERFAPIDGIRSFVVGTGGKNHYAINATKAAGSEVSNADTYGLLSLTLKADGYDWQFLPEPGKTFTDTGSGTCR